MPKAVNGMKICSNPNCIHCGQPQPVENFRNEKRNSDGLSARCKDCIKTDYDKTKDQRNEQRRKHRTEIIDKIHAEKHDYYERNKESVKEKSKIFRSSPANYDTYASQLEPYEEVRRDPNNFLFLQVRCKNAACHEWFTPTAGDVQERIKALTKLVGAENNLYCSEECKLSCPTYRTINGNKKIFKKKSRDCGHENNMQDTLREMVLQLDNYTCQMCGDSLEEFPDLKLVCHHIKPMATDLMLASDVDNCITLCEECHGKVHTLPGCSLVELQKKAREQRESLKEIINKN